MTGLSVAAISIGRVSSSRGTKFGVRNSSGKKIRLAELVAAALRVLSAMICRKPRKTTDHSAVSRTSSTKPSGPLAISMPKAIPSAITAVAITRPLANSAISRPSTMAVRGIGTARSLSK